MKVGLREIIFIVLLMGIPLGAWRFVFKPQNAHNAEMLHRIEAKQAKLRQLNQATGTIGDLQKQIASLHSAMSFFRSKLPNEKEIDKVLQEVWKLAETNQLTTKSIRTLQRGSEPLFATQHAEQPIAVQLEGDFAGFYSFLLALEDQPRIMRITKLTLKKPEKGSQGMVKAEFVMSIFFENAAG